MVQIPQCQTLPQLLARLVVPHPWQLFELLRTGKRDAGKGMLEKGSWKRGAGKGTCPVTQKEDEIWSIPALRATFTSSYHPHERVSRGRLILMLSPGACVQQRCKMKQNFTSTVEGTLLLMTETPESHFTLWQNESVLERHFSPSSSSAMASDSSDSS